MSFSARTIHSPRRTSRQSHFGKLFSWILGVMIIGIIYLYSMVSSVGSIVISPDTYNLDKGSTPMSISSVFDIDVASWRYKLWLRYFAPEIKNLQAGGYRVDVPMTVSDLFRTVLVKPVYTDLTITILPGWNSYDIDDYLYRKDIIENPGDFLLAMRDNFTLYQKKYTFLEGVPSLEGFLYPDTYRISKDATAKNVIDKMLSTFQSRVGDSYMKLGEKAYTKLILASIVEREERISAEKSTVAGVLEKRVQEGIPMGADATVCYGYAKTQKQCTPAFIGEVIGIKHPYNTRNKQGYPPTPISTISLDTWNAAINPESSPYYYYLHDSEGVIHYGKTLDEHNANKRKYLQ